MATQTQDIEREFSRDEKSGIMHNEHAQGGLSQEDADFLNNFPEERKKAIIRKVDVSFLSNQYFSLLTQISGD